MTTEQMDWLDDERAGRHERRALPHDTIPAAEHTVTVETAWPIPAKTLAGLTAAAPDHADVFVTVLQGGSQRDPYPVGARIVAKWIGA